MITNELMNIFSSMSEPQLLHYYEPLPGIFIAESAKVVDRALTAGYYPLSMLIEDKRRNDPDVDELVSRSLAVNPEREMHVESRKELEKITGYAMTGGILCAMRRKDAADHEEILKGAYRIAVLENVMNPTNVGAMIRSAAALDMDAVLLGPGCADPMYRRAIRVSMGTVFQIPWGYYDGDMNTLKKLGFTTAAMALCDDSVSLDELNPEKDEKVAVILGSEGEGLKKETIENCDMVVKIPMKYGVDSLNVSAAGAVAFWQIRRR